MKEMILFLSKDEERDEQIRNESKSGSQQLYIGHESRESYQWMQNLMVGGGNICSTVGLRQTALLSTQPGLFFFFIFTI